MKKIKINFKGFPGWHIECSAMSMKYLGETFDIHCGGIDHIPVHHTNEIAQSEAATGKKYVNYWLHSAFLQLKEGRMGKSEKNIILVDDLVEDGFRLLAYRYLVLTSHYRSTLVFSKESLAAAQTALDRLYDFMARLREVKSRSKDTKVGKLMTGVKKSFEAAINDDLNMPEALSTISKFTHKANRLMDENHMSEEQAKEIHKLMCRFDKVLGLKLGEVKKDELPKSVMDFIKKREQLREQKKWKEADKIRADLRKIGVVLEDTDSGTRWRKT